MEREARQAGKHGRAAHCGTQYTGSIPREEFERGSYLLGGTLLAWWCLVIGFGMAVLP